MFAELFLPTYYDVLLLLWGHGTHPPRPTGQALYLISVYSVMNPWWFLFLFCSFGLFFPSQWLLKNFLWLLCGQVSAHLLARAPQIFYLRKWNILLVSHLLFFLYLPFLLLVGLTGGNKFLASSLIFLHYLLWFLYIPFTSMWSIPF